MEKSKRFAAPEAAIRLWFWLFAAAALIAAVCMPDRGQMFAGLGRLCVLPYQSANSYFDAANGGFAGTFLNVALVCAICAAVYSLPGSKPDGVSVLAFFLTAGFAFWGITVLNIWFCFAGTLIVCLIRKVNPCTQGNVFLFSTGIAPLMTDLLIRYPGADAHGVTFFGCVLALLACCLIGLVLPAGLAHGPKMHKGYDLYNAAVPIGLVAFFLRAVLYRVLGGTLADGVGVGAGEGYPLVTNVFCIVVFVLAIVLGLSLGGSFKTYGKLLRDSGFGADYGAGYGVGTGILNFGIYGLFIVLYYNLIGANWNAATIGCVFCMVCCCFKGSHPGNVWPIMVGYVAASFATKGLCAALGTDFTTAINAQAIVIGLCFANGLSPVAGKYGWWAGIVFGVLHLLGICMMVYPARRLPALQRRLHCGADLLPVHPGHGNVLQDQGRKGGPPRKKIRAALHNSRKSIRFSGDFSSVPSGFFKIGIDKTASFYYNNLVCGGRRHDPCRKRDLRP